MENKPVEEIAPHANSIVINDVAYDIHNVGAKVPNYIFISFCELTRIMRIKDYDKENFAFYIYENGKNIVNATRDILIYALGSEQFDKAFPNFKDVPLSVLLDYCFLIQVKLKLVF